MAIGWGFVGKHKSEEVKSPVVLSKIELGSYQSVVEEGAFPF